MPSFLTSSLFKNSSIYIITDGISQAIPFLLLPLISHYLSPADYGIITNFNVLFAILSIICFMTTAGVLPVIYYKKDKEALRLYISNMLFLNTIVTVGCLVMTLIFNRTIDHLIQLPLFYQILCLVTVWFASITNLNMILWRCEERPWSFGKYKIALSSLNIIITIWFVVILLWGWQGRVYSQCIAIIVINEMPFKALNLYQMNLFRTLSVLITSSIVKANAYEEAVRDGKYIDQTDILISSEFKKLVNIREEERKQGLSDYCLLKVECNSDILGVYEKIYNMLRNTDSFGVTEQNELMVLLGNTQEKDAEYVLKRFKDRGINASIVGWGTV